MNSMLQFQKVRTEQSVSHGESTDSKKVCGYIFDHLISNCDAMSLCHPAMVLLMRMDAQNGSDLARTLYEYIVNERNAVLASAKLYMHRNTLNYRLKKISGLVDVDLEDESVREHLRITYVIYSRLCELEQSRDSFSKIYYQALAAK